MKVLSVKQPWAHLICSGLKDVENRTWKLPEKMKGKRVLIHASKSAEYDCAAFHPYAALFQLGKFHEMLSEQQKRDIIKNSSVRSAIIGSVEIVDCVINHLSIWAEKSEGVLVGNKFFYKEGQKPIYNWVLANPVLFKEPILNVKGQLGFFKPKID